MGVAGPREAERVGEGIAGRAAGDAGRDGDALLGDAALRLGEGGVDAVVQERVHEGARVGVRGALRGGDELGGDDLASLTVNLPQLGDF